MKKMLLVGMLALLSVPAFAQYQSSEEYQNALNEAVSNEFQDMSAGRLYDNQNEVMSVNPDAVKIPVDVPGGHGGGFGGGHPGGGMPGGGFGGGHPGGGMPGGGFGGGHPGGGFPGGGHPGGGFPGGGHPGGFGGDRFPGHGGWGHGSFWWRGAWGPTWYNQYAWWPGYGYYNGACFAEDNDGYLFSGAGANGAVYNCDVNSPVDGCVFVGCD